MPWNRAAARVSRTELYGVALFSSDRRLLMGDSDRLDNSSMSGRMKNGRGLIATRIIGRKEGSPCDGSIGGCGMYIGVCHE